MEKGSVKEFLKGKTILVTGATGFLAKVFVEKILRVQPLVNKLYLLIRASNSSLAAERLQNEFMKKELFKVLREKWGAHNFDSFMSEKVVAVAGDVSLDNLGIIDANVRHELFKELDVIVNSAATTRFNERYDIAMGINTTGAFHVLNFAKNCCKMQILLHLSTAYVCKEGRGIISEKLPHMDQSTLNGFSILDVEFEKNFLEQKLNQLKAENPDEKTIRYELKSFGIQRAMLHGWSNTYVFTKAMGEMLLVNMKDNVPLIIIRPTMVISTHSEPFPGWIEGVRNLDNLVLGYGKGAITCFPGDSKTILDAIPADMVANAMIIAMVARSKNLSQDFIFHISSSLRNPLRISDLVEISQTYFTKSPLENVYGKPAAIPKKNFCIMSVAEFDAHMKIRYILPLKGLNLVNQVCCQLFEKYYTDNYRKIKLLIQLAELYKPYTFFEGIFDDKNTESLQIIAEGAAEEDYGFNFDPKSINWMGYFINDHIPGLVKFCL